MGQEASVGNKLAALAALRDNLRSSDALKLLRKSLDDRANHVVERAADLIAKTEDNSFVEDLLRAYRRLMVNPFKNDPGCLGKTAIVRALVRLECNDAELYREGIAYQQREPVWGGDKDSAAELRGACAVGLINSVSSLEVLNRCAVLLVDPFFEARAGAARAIGALGQPEGAALLRLKLLVGDKAPEVLGECCSSILRLDRQWGKKFVVELLSSKNADVCVQAALALGESRLPDTFEPLRRAFEQQFDAAVRESLLICIGLLRSTESCDFLLSLIHPQDLTIAAAAINALKMYGKSGDLRTRTQAAVTATGDARLQRIFQQEWSDEK